MCVYIYIERERAREERERERKKKRERERETETESESDSESERLGEMVRGSLREVSVPWRPHESCRCTPKRRQRARCQGVQSGGPMELSKHICNMGA